ncbi:MAG TPA: GNAT family N-acetyltransferase [Bacillota bacterium]|nr:GNAT family N-acetyltransferase [Bacillota bacterium]
MNIFIVKTKEEKERALRIRRTVFVDEQNVPLDEELDEHEDEAIHFLGELNGKAIAASRLRWVDGYGKLERICVLKNERGNGYGKQLIQAMEREIVKNGGQKAKLNAQKHAEKFYKQLGYQTVSDEFMDAGIPHVTMVKHLETDLTA